MRYTVIWIGLLVGIGFYVADIVIDVFVFGNGTLTEEILNPSYHEVWMRTSVLIVAAAFAIYIHILLSREHAISNRAKTAETFLNSIIDNSPDMIFIKDASELRFIRVNHTGERLLGLTNRELLGKNDHDLFPEPQADFFTHNDREVLESGAEIDIPEEEIDTAGHGKRWLRTKKVPIFGDNGQPVYLLGISEDITEARQAETDRKKTEARLQTLFDSAAEFIFVIDPDGEIIKANRYVYEHSGYATDEIVGRYIKEFFTEASQKICDCNFPELRERGYNQADVEFVCKDGNVIDMECSATAVPDEDGNFTTYLIIQRDVTDKKQAQKERQRQQEEMAHVMRLSTMGEMVSGMAHELNQPLTALVSYCGTALKLARDMPVLPEGYLETLERASEQAHRAGDVIRHLREFVSKGSNNITRVVLNELVQGLIDFISWELRDSDIQLAFLAGSPACEVLVDKVQIEQVLINLIRNSIEAIREAGISNGQVDIATRLATDGSIEVSVTDNGPGIDPTMAASLFEPYQTSKETGMGMGLSISRSIVEVHNGKLWTEVQRPQGAMFCMSIPGCD
jgi:PAS domain S-box-containing protein